jgi:cysteine synthase
MEIIETTAGSAALGAATEAMDVRGTGRWHAHVGSLGPDAARRRYADVRELIASPANATPLVRLNRVVRPPLEAYLKLEWMNPFGSIKDRTARYLLEGMRQRGELAGRELVEATSGNTGIALAALAALEGIPLTVTIPSGVPAEKLVLLKMLGATVMPTPDDLCPVDNPRDGAIALARAIVDSPAHRGRYAMPDQYANPDNVRAHYETTGPEIWEQTEGRVRSFVAGFGTCGTITGVGRFLKERDRSIRIVAVEPQAGHRLPGLKNLQEAKPPAILDRSVIDEVIRVPDGPAYDMTRRLFREEGLIVGPSTGAIAHAIAALDGATSGLVVGISPDGGQKYASFYADLAGGDARASGLIELHTEV